MKKNTKLFLVWVIIICTITLNVLSPISANASNEHNSVIRDLNYDDEIINETYEDEKSNNKAGNWKRVDGDGVSRGAFHRAVQEEIKKEFSDNNENNNIKIEIEQEIGTIVGNNELVDHSLSKKRADRSIENTIF